MFPTSFLSILFLSILILQQGCATTAPPRPQSSQLSEEVRTKIRTVGITVSEELPHVTLDLPSKGALSGAGCKAGKWTWDSVKIISWSGDSSGVVHYLSGFPVGAVVGAIMLAVAPVAAVVGALSGAVEAPSAAAVEAMETQVRRVLQDERLIGEFGKRVHDHITNRTDVIPTLFPRAGMAYADGGDTETGAQPDARLTIVLKSVGLQGTFDVNPPLALYLETNVNLVYKKRHTISEGAVAVYRRTFRYRSDARILAEWTADDA